MTSVFLVAIVTLSAAAPSRPALQTPAKAPLRVFVHTDEIGGDFTGRHTSVTDLSTALAAKKKVFTVVEIEENADVVVNVLDRTVDTPKVVIGIGARPGMPPGSAVSPARAVKLRARVKHADQEEVLVNKNSPLENQRGWKAAAEDLATQIERWVTARTKR
jgi:hypothetical protein